jgi:hypothetical protein
MDPDAGEQAVVTGAAPPVTDGALYETSCDSWLMFSTVTLLPQVI